jgi:hypothetical protein
MLGMRAMLELPSAINAQLESTALHWDRLLVPIVPLGELSKQILGLEMESMCLILQALL